MSGKNAPYFIAYVTSSEYSVSPVFCSVILTLEAGISKPSDVLRVRHMLAAQHNVEPDEVALFFWKQLEEDVSFAPPACGPDYDDVDL